MIYYSENFNSVKKVSKFILRHPTKCSSVICSYNSMWSSLKKEEQDVMVFFCTFQYAKNPLFFRENISEELYFSSIQKNLTFVKEMDFIMDYDGDLEYFSSVLSQKINPSLVYYKEDEDLAVRSSDSKAFKINQRLFFLMIFFD